MFEVQRLQVGCWSLRPLSQQQLETLMRKGITCVSGCGYCQMMCCSSVWRDVTCISRLKNAMYTHTDMCLSIDLSGQTCADMLQMHTAQKRNMWVRMETYSYHPKIISSIISSILINLHCHRHCHRRLSYHDCNRQASIVNSFNMFQQCINVSSFKKCYLLVILLTINIWITI